MRRACFYLCQNTGPDVDADGCCSFFPWVHMVECFWGSQNEWHDQAVQPGQVGIVLLFSLLRTWVLTVGKLRSESFPEPLRGELQHLRAGTTVYTWTWTRWFLRKKSKGCMAKALPLNQHARFGMEGAEEQISGSLSPHWQLFIQPSRFTVECSSCALKLELICISCYNPELLCKVKFYL